MFGGKASRNRFDPGLNTFPDILVDAMAAEMALDRRGGGDGRAGVPPSDAATPSSAELEAVDAVRSIRRQALGQYEMELQSYAARVAEAGAARERVQMMVGEAENQLRNLTREEENRLENARVHVTGMQAKLDAFRARNRLVGPPRAAGSVVLTVGLILIVALIETGANGYFFAAQNTLGYLGGVVAAAIISAVNIAFCFLAGHFTRYVNRRQFGWKLFGLVVFAAFLGFAVTLNLAVAHFRDALATLGWEAALVAAIDGLRIDPAGLRNFESWLVVGFGALVSITAFLKGLTLYDPYPGFNRVHDDYEDAVDDYADAYAEAQEALDAAFEAARDRLEDEAARRRIELKSAVDAVFARGTLTRNLTAFLEVCDEAARRLLRVYRDANLRVRKDPGPAYFNEPFAFPDYAAPEFEQGDRAEALREIERIDEVVHTGTDRLLAARESALDAYPTVREIKAGDPAPRPRVVPAEDRRARGAA